MLHALRVNEIKPPRAVTSVADNFPLESKKGSRNEEKTLFWDCSWSLGLFLKT